MAQLRTALRRGRKLLAEVRQHYGDGAYERYAAGCRAAGTEPLDRGRYFAAEAERRYRSTSRCC